MPHTPRPARPRAERRDTHDSQYSNRERCVFEVRYGAATREPRVHTWYMHPRAPRPARGETLARGLASCDVLLDVRRRVSSAGRTPQSEWIGAGGDWGRLEEGFSDGSG